MRKPDPVRGSGISDLADGGTSSIRFEDQDSHSFDHASGSKTSRRFAAPPADIRPRRRDLSGDVIEDDDSVSRQAPYTAEAALPREPLRRASVYYAERLRLGRLSITEVEDILEAARDELEARGAGR